MKNLKTKYLLYTGISIPVIFWSTTIVCSIILADYNHLTRMVSELGELGTKTQFLFTIGLTLCGVLTIPFVVGLYKAGKSVGLNPIPILIILSYATIAGPAIFPYPLQIHGVLGMPSILVLLSPILTIFLWNGKVKLANIKQIAVLSILFMTLGFLVFIPDFLDAYFGLKQRFFHLGWSIWFIYLSISFIKLTNTQKQ